MLFTLGVALFLWDFFFQATSRRTAAIPSGRVVPTS
jgi:hypothetical protein